MKRFAAIIGGLAVIGAVSCGKIPSNRQVQPQAAAAMSVTANQVVANSHQGGNRTLQVSLLPPIASGFSAQSIVHRWVSGDVTEYDLVLNAGGQNLLTVQVLPQDGQSRAAQC